MAYVEPDAFDDKQVELIYVAATTHEARSIEAILTAEGIDYTLRAEPFIQFGFLVAMDLPGVGFYVISGQAGYTRGLLGRDPSRAGHGPLARATAPYRRGSS